MNNVSISIIVSALIFLITLKSQIFNIGKLFFFFLSPLVRLVQFNNSHSVVFIQCKLTFHPFTPRYDMGWRFMTKHAATPLPRMGRCNTSELSTITYMPACQANQHHLTLWSRKDLVRALKKLGYGVVSLENDEKSPSPTPGLNLSPSQLSKS